MIAALEAAAAAALAARSSERDVVAGKRAGLVLTGGNIDRALYRAILTEEDPTCA